MKVKLFEKEMLAMWEFTNIKSIIFDCPLKSKNSQKYILTTDKDEIKEFACAKFMLYNVEQ